MSPFGNLNVKAGISKPYQVQFEFTKTALFELWNGVAVGERGNYIRWCKRKALISKCAGA